MLLQRQNDYGEDKMKSFILSLGLLGMIPLERTEEVTIQELNVIHNQFDGSIETHTFYDREVYNRDEHPTRLRREL